MDIINKLRSALFLIPKTGSPHNFKGHYKEWQRKRIDSIIRHYGKSFFKGKTLLEVGCGYGDIGAVFQKLGASVTCSDAREEHLKVLNARYPKIKTIMLDLDKEWPSNHYDVLIHMGVLYHLKDYVVPLQNACRNCDHLILETEVSDSDDPSFVLTVQEQGYDQAVNGLGNRPSAEAVERVLSSCNMQFERIKDTRCNSGIHRYDWPVQNTGKWEHGLRRFWFAKKKTTLAD